MRTASSKDVAAALGVKPTTVQRYARDGRIPYEETPGGHRRFDIDEVRLALGAGTAAPFVQNLELDPLAAGGLVTYSASAAREAQLRTVRAEAPAHSEPRRAGGPSELGQLIAKARRVLVTTSR